MLELRHIHKELAGKTVLEDVCLQVERGKTLVIVGSSGTGKSVTLQHMIGLLKPDHGEVIVDGRELHKASYRELEEIRNYFGMLFQGGALINWMNIFENIALPLREHNKLTEKEIAEKVRDSLAMVNLEGIEKKMPSELSGGMIKRAGLARAIIKRPPIILYDEPTAGLDPIMARNIDNIIHSLQTELGVTSVVVTHDLITAFTIGDKVALLHEGKIASINTPEKFYHNASDFVREFVHAQEMPEKLKPKR